MCKQYFLKVTFFVSKMKYMQYFCQAIDTAILCRMVRFWHISFEYV